MNKAYLNYLEARKSPNTVRAYVRDIDSCLNYIGKPENEITSKDLEKWQESILSLSSATVARQTASIRGYFKYLKKEEIIDSNPSFELEGIEIENEEKIPLTATQVRDMFNCADKIRSKAIISLLASTGIRVSELINLTVSQYQCERVEFKGKGNRNRKVFIPANTRETIDQYLLTRGESEFPNLFLSNGGKPMQANNISIMLKNTAQRAGIEFWDRISPHWLRNTAATLQSEAGQPTEVIQKMLGHKRVQTTIEHYIKIGDKRLKSAMTAQLW